MKDRSPESIAATLTNLDKLIELTHKKLATLEEMKTSLRIAQVWPDAWDAKGRVRIIDNYQHNIIHPLGKCRPPTEELRNQLYHHIRKSTLVAGNLFDGERYHPITKLEMAYIRGYLDTLETMQ